MFVQKTFSPFIARFARLLSGQRQERPLRIVALCLKRQEKILQDVAKRIGEGRSVEPLKPELSELQSKNPTDSDIYEVRMTASLEDPDAVIAIYQQARDSNADTSNLTRILLSCLARHGRLNEALTKLRTTSDKISIPTYEALFRAAPKDITVINEIRELAKNIARNKLDVAYLAALAKVSFKDARAFVKEHPLPRAWNVLFDAAGIARDLDGLLEVRKDLATPSDQQKIVFFMALAKIFPDELFARVKNPVSPAPKNAVKAFEEFDEFVKITDSSHQFPLVGYLSIPDFEKAKAVIDHAELTKGEKSPKLLTYYFETLETHNKLQQAMEILNELERLEKPISSFSARMVRAHLRNNHIEQAKSVVDSMREKGLEIPFDIVRKFSTSGLDL